MLKISNEILANSYSSISSIGLRLPIIFGPWGSSSSSNTTCDNNSNNVNEKMYQYANELTCNSTILAKINDNNKHYFNLMSVKIANITAKHIIYRYTFHQKLR